MCAHLVTREPSSSWAVCTSQPCAFQQEVASSDLGGTRPKGGNHLGSRREGKRGTPGPLLPPKENAKSQCSGCQPATACLEGRRLRSRRSPGLHWPHSRFHTVHVQCEQARENMSRAFFSPFGKTCRVFLPVILAKDVASTSRQEVTLLTTLYLLSSPLTIRYRKYVLARRTLRFAKERVEKEQGQEA